MTSLPPAGPRAFHELVSSHAVWLEASGYALTTVRNRRHDLRRFVAWCLERHIRHPQQLTDASLEEYRVALHYTPKADGTPLGWGGRVHKLLAVKRFLRWARRMRVVTHDAGADLTLPPRPRALPRHVLSAAETELVLAVPNTRRSGGIRDRAVLETLYSTGIRRLELIRLKPSDLDAGRGVMAVRLGKGGRDRVVPIGNRAMAWIARWSGEARPHFVRGVDPGNLFLSLRGRALSPNRLSELVSHYVDAARIGKTGSCHLFRHTMATLLLENDADIRYIQEMLGHARLTTTELYTRVSIARLKAVHERAHPACRAGAGAEEV